MLQHKVSFRAPPLPRPLLPPLHLRPAPVALDTVDDARQHSLHALLLGGGGEDGLAREGHAAGVLKHRLFGLLCAVPLDDLLPVAADQLILKTPKTRQDGDRSFSVVAASEWIGEIAT